MSIRNLDHHAADAMLDSERICTLDADIERAATVVLAGLHSAQDACGGSLASQRLLFLGAGRAAVGIADLVVAAMVAQGVAPARARSVCWLFDSRGLVVARRGDLAWRKRAYAHEHAPVLDFRSAVHELKPTAIIGVAAAAGEFTREVIEEMTRVNDRPIVIVLSKPSSKAECNAQQAREWSGGRALFGSDSPLDRGWLARTA
jgi:malate dehydrogenase (oxaloacetate-decarboxylating)(NADP+)